MSDVVIREAAVRHCRLLSAAWGDAVPARVLTEGFMVADQRVELVAWGRGIFKPQVLTDGPLTLVSSLGSSYEDEQVEDDVLAYDYAPAGSNDWANAGLVRVAALGRPLIMLRQVKPKPAPEYMVLAPVFITGHDDATRKFTVSLVAANDDADGVAAPSPPVFAKRYAPTVVQARLHQAHFRREILGAYKDRCCVCALAERPLLDAAHIVPDRLPEGLATVVNGMAMCPTHHRAFDQRIVTIDADYRVEVHRDRLTRADTEPTARALLDHHGKPLSLPRERTRWPHQDLLEWHRRNAA